jgi:hypothetical protein
VTSTGSLSQAQNIFCDVQSNRFVPSDSVISKFPNNLAKITRNSTHANCGVPRKTEEDAEMESDTQQRPKKGMSLLDVLALYPIFDTLCSHLDIGGLLTLRKLSKQLSTHLSSHMNERWNVNRRLGRFVRNPIGFRSQMARHDALISGSFVCYSVFG